MRYQWHYDVDACTHFCIIGNMVAQIHFVAPIGVFDARLFGTHGDTPIELIRQDGWDDVASAQAWAESTLRQFASSQQQEVFALSQIAHLAEKSWQVLIFESMNRMEFFLDVPAIGYIQVLKGDRYTWMVQGAQQQNASGVADSLTTAKVDAVSALVKIYLQHTIHTDGNTELMKLQKVQTSLQKVQEV